jgi:phage terminase large subunit
MAEAKTKQVKLIEVFKDLFDPHRYKIYYGGRGSGKSTSIAIVLVLLASQKPLRILCAREMQNSIQDSVHKLLSDLIWSLGLQKQFTITKTEIKSKAGAEFIFKGLRHSVGEVKSMEGIDICWVEEAQGVSSDSWDILIPTIRKPDSEIWISFNPDSEQDPTYQQFVVNPPPDSVVHKVNWDMNPYISQELIKEKDHCMKTDYQKYLHVWEGNPKTLSKSCIFADKYRVAEFETPPLEKMEGERFFFGADWGFAEDPTCLVRCFIKDKCLWVDYEAYGKHVDIDKIPELFLEIPEAGRWLIKGDNSRPEIISALNKLGMRVTAAKKWQGSVEDGIAHLKNFEQIIIHPRCKNLIQEMALYSYKVDRVTGEILPTVISKHDHLIDSLRYALDGYILSKNAAKQTRLNFMGR